MNDLPAFPAKHFDLADGEHGLTIRDYFAAHAVSYLMDHTTTYKYVAAEAYKLADAMMAARK